MTDQEKPGGRIKIGLIDSEPAKMDKVLKGLTPLQQTMREATLSHFKANKIKKYISEQTQYVNPSRQIGEAIRFLFDEHGRPPVNAPLEEIIEERKKIEAQIRWLEALSKELRNNLIKIKEIEDLALEMLEYEDHD